MSRRATDIPVDSAGAEIRAHGTPDFPCGCYYCDPLAHETPWHWHEEFEYLFVTAGELLYLAGSDRYVLREGDAAIVNGGVPHAVQPLRGSHAMEGDLVCHPRMLYGDRGSVIWERYFRRLELPGSLRSCMLRHDGPSWEREAAALITKAWMAMASKEELHELTVRDALARATLLALLNADCTTGREAPKSSEREADRIKRMVAFIEGHYDEPLTLRQIAAIGDVSVREAQRGFKEVIGESPVDYLTSHRLLVAARQLKATDLPVGSIAHGCGFGSQSYFARRFRERYGCTPSDYRELG